MKALQFLIKPLFLFLICIFYACDSFPLDDDNDIPPSPGEYYTCLWLTAMQDAFVQSELPEFTGNTFSLDVNHGLPIGEKRSYIQFLIPLLPAGTEVLEAYINVFENTQQNPGTRSISVLEASEEWTATTLTWDNQPTPPGSGGIGSISIKGFEGINKWRGTQNMYLKAQEIIDNPSSHHGFILNNDVGFNFTRGFTAMNAPQGRTIDSFGEGPRFLLKVKSTEPITIDNIDATVSGPNEFYTLYGANTPFLAYRIQTGDSWPTEWEIDTQ